MAHLSKKLTLRSTAMIVKKHPMSVARMAKAYPDFPALERVGRSVFIDSNKFYSWMSKQAGQKVTSEDNLLRGHDLQEYYSKSHTWLWSQVKLGNLTKPFKINRTNYWLEKDIVGEAGAEK